VDKKLVFDWAPNCYSLKSQKSILQKTRRNTSTYPWEYPKGTCEANARAEAVDDRVEFRKASASKLPFSDEYFDAVVSNRCFLEVSDTGDKGEVLQEAVRVLKKGGRFVFQDLFLLKQVYSEPQELVATIKGWGIADFEFIETGSLPFISSALKTTFYGV
jgi:SAM-dependent methyltransferase